MITIQCPWCAESARLDLFELDELTCESCGLQAEFAADPVRDRIAQAA
jgi:hypothetical protein